jgi:hypothetical protein
VVASPKLIASALAAAGSVAVSAIAVWIASSNGDVGDLLTVAVPFTALFLFDEIRRGPQACGTDPMPVGMAVETPLQAGLRELPWLLFSVCVAALAILLFGMAGAGAAVAFAAGQVSDFALALIWVVRRRTSLYALRGKWWRLEARYFRSPERERGKAIAMAGKH